MVLKLCLMASHGYPPGLVSQHELVGLGGSLKGFQPLLSSPVTKPEIIRYSSPALRPNPCGESRKSQSECFNSSQSVNIDLPAQRPLPNDVQATCPDAVLFGFGIVEKCTKHDKIVQFLKSSASETEISEEHRSLMSDSMDFQLLGTDVPQQPFSTSLIYPNSKIDIRRILLEFIGDSAFSPDILVHPEDLVSFLGAGSAMKDFLSIVAESYLSKNSHKGEKHSLLVPYFSRLDINEAEARTHTSLSKTQSTLTAPLKSSPEKFKVKPSSKKKKKVGRERDLYKRNYLHACESLLSLMMDTKHRQKTAIHSLKKAGPELPELLSQFSAGIAGTGLAVLLSVIWKVACGRVPFCASKLFTTGFGFGLVWLSWAVNKLRDTIIGISKNTGRLGLKESSNLKDQEIIQKLDKNIRDIYFRSAALLAVAVLSVA
ncbi:uncharacterized protein LOC114720731 isoform X1 [Neltuma alba]|uniref:uncharacterized protein LOC114720708 isoform X1 n=1 Tax=Neltuma alba TaxID=207710 RepID=UPI0010A39203|nr:uncharacterized protein LOC114720708 isoform X1 [Prosopis alba]XP_028762245.1 uncharacterized protein LOC114720731 isoform X1 [Prosopis alba]